MIEPVTINDPIDGLITGKEELIHQDGLPLPIAVEPGQGTPLNLDDNWSITDRAMRPYNAGSFVFSSASAHAAPIFDTDAMTMLRGNSELMNMVTQFQYVRYKTCELEFLTNTSQWQTGALLNSVIYNRLSDSFDVITRQTTHHTIWQPSQGESIKITLPYMDWMDWVTLDKDISARVMVSVLVRLTAANAITTSLPFTVMAHFTGFEVMFPIPSFPLPQGYDNILYYPSTSKIFRPDGSAVVMGNIIGGISDEQSLIGENTVAQFLSHPYLFNEFDLTVVGERTPYHLDYMKVSGFNNAAVWSYPNFTFIQQFTNYMTGSVQITLTAICDGFTHGKVALFLTGSALSNDWNKRPHLIWDLKTSKSFTFIVPIHYNERRMIPTRKLTAPESSSFVDLRVCLYCIQDFTVSSTATKISFVGQCLPMWTTPGSPGALQFFQIMRANPRGIRPSLAVAEGEINGIPILG